ncbi:MAG: hypothetical protein KatS3mg129_1639 [Leptospiraceae bacterium]|nr:MAG: hypothetical protein KatS3mg129_1639 [Leptospiraceae bacterium]
MEFYGIFFLTLFLAYWNGANDNYKGVATLYGSNLTNYFNALWWATITTFFGSLSSIYLANELIQNFSGYKIFPESFLNNSALFYAILTGSSLTILIATITGFPVSTTHSIIGAIYGISILLFKKIKISFLLNKFLLPLLISPLIAITVTHFLNLFFKFLKTKLNPILNNQCICIEKYQVATYPNNCNYAIYTVRMDHYINCSSKTSLDYFIKIHKDNIISFLHFLSAGFVSFSRGLNDTPKIAGLILLSSMLSVKYYLLFIGIAMALGGLWNAKKVAFVISKHITPLNSQKGLIANLTTSLIVFFASIGGFPVSTTHVSIGSLFGIGFYTKQANKKKIKEILFSWFITMPLSAILSIFIYKII